MFSSVRQGGRRGLPRWLAVQPRLDGGLSAERSSCPSDVPDAEGHGLQMTALDRSAEHQEEQSRKLRSRDGSRDYNIQQQGSVFCREDMLLSRGDEQ